MKFLTLLIPALLIWWILRLLRSPSSVERKTGKPRAENMVACAKCGLHVPEQEAIIRNGIHYCSEDHAREADS